jgi:L-2,4-diaminobutyrate decarboxylase
MPKAKDASLPDNSRISTQWTRRMNSLKLWLTLRAHGRKGYEELIARQFDLAASFADWIRASKGYELAATPMLPIVNFRLKKIADDDIAAAHNCVVEDVTRDGKRWISETVVCKKSVLRMMVISYLTEERHLQDLERALDGAASRLSTAG